MSKLMIVEVPLYSCEFKGIREVRELVRCGECKHGEYREDHDDYLCSNNGICVHDADWFCADGERSSE